MHNIYQPLPALIKEIIEETSTIKTFNLQPQQDFSFGAGQFIELSLAGFGEALGGITIYLTGAGGSTIWSKLRARQKANNKQPSVEDDDIPLVSHKLQSKQRAFFNRVVAPMQRWNSFWPVFIASAMLVSPFYFVGLGAGALGMGLRKFFLISWAGKTVKGLYVAFAGYWGLYFLLQWLGG